MNRSSAIIWTAIIVLAVASVVFNIKDTNKDTYVNAYLEQHSTVDEEQIDSTASDVPMEIIVNRNFTDQQAKGTTEASVSESPKQGYYAGEQTIKLSFDNSAGELYYTTDGSMPDANSQKYTDNGILLDKTATLNVAVINKEKRSNISSFSYVIMKDTFDYTYGYGYKSLNTKEKALYTQLYNSFSNFEKSIKITKSGISMMNAEKVYWCVHYDNPLLFQIPFMLCRWQGTSSNVTGLIMSYDYTSAQCDLYKKRFIAEADKIIKSADGSQSLMDYLKVIHDKILLATSYGDNSTDEESVYRAFGTLVNHIGVCEAYSRTFEYFCRRIGIENLLVVGDVDGGHIWNMIKLDNEWYHVDLTWDDEDDGSISYYYFNVNDIDLKSEGRIISKFITDDYFDTLDANFYPIPKSTASDYYFYNYYDENHSVGNIFNFGNWLSNYVLAA